MGGAEEGAKLAFGAVGQGAQNSLTENIL